MRNRTLAAALLLLCAAAPAAAQTPTPPPQAALPAQMPTPAPTPEPLATPAARPTPAPAGAKPAASEAQKKYDAMLEKAKRGEGPVDYRALRFAYYETPGYSPLVGMLIYRSLWTTVMQQNWAEATRQAESVLEKTYVDVNAHMVAAIAYREQGDEEKARLHRRWADGLLDSIKAGGDGKSADAAWHVISVSEEYAVLRSLGLRPAGQSLVNEKGHAYDVMKTVDPKSTEATYYFNIDKPFGAYGRK
jgi:hypothetical protein